ncbi:MAG: DUF3899 domain-containing protein [Erysipelotrichaceae bacterium]|nr:DUF3899 domain-containing protein [Erysipelotrichaceae bacterium]
MKFKNLNWGALAKAILICLIYPVARGIIAKNHMVAFCDSMTIIGLLAIIFGVFNEGVLQGDYDIHSYIARRKALRNEKVDYEAYRAQQENKRKDSFNYPLLVGIIFTVASIIVAAVID